MGHTIVKTCCAEGVVPPTALGGGERKERFRMCQRDVREFQTRLECADGVKMLQASSSMIQSCQASDASVFEVDAGRQDVLCRGCGFAHSARVIRRRARFRRRQHDVRELQTRCECADGVKVLQAPPSMM